MKRNIALIATLIGLAVIYTSLLVSGGKNTRETSATSSSEKEKALAKPSAPTNTSAHAWVRKDTSETVRKFIVPEELIPDLPLELQPFASQVRVFLREKETAGAEARIPIPTVTTLETDSETTDVVSDISDELRATTTNRLAAATRLAIAEGRIRTEIGKENFLVLSNWLRYKWDMVLADAGITREEVEMRAPE